MASTLANQLENLEITDSSLTPNAPFTIKTLPKLRRLYIRGTGSDSTDWSAIGGLLSCVPGLEEFVCGWQLNMPDPVLPALSIIPELRILGLTAKPLDQSARAAWRERVPVFAEKCPKLRRMNRLLLWETSWDILREEDGKVTVTEYAL
ncbi:hypothetical protein FRC06_001588 [Ceratobasidium sp. 370]|nr:hypothetical protein FRC06_001588 [Ceratobasidium sp. 370]